MEIIRYLDDAGHPGFNKVNLNAWKKTGFQQWLRTEAEACASATVSDTNEL
jgi:hypothetical protein